MGLPLPERKESILAGDEAQCGGLGHIDAIFESRLEGTHFSIQRAEVGPHEPRGFRVIGRGF